MDFHRCTELYPLWSMTFTTSYSHSCSVGRGRGSTNCKLTVLEESIICFTKQGARAHRTVITCWGACKVSVLKILPALHNNYVNAGLCWNPAELLGILLMSSFPILPSVLSVLFFLCYTSFPELHPNCSDNVGLIQFLQCYSTHCGDRKQGQSCYSHSNFENAHQMTKVPYLFIFKPLWQGFIGLSTNNYFARCQ